MVQIPSAPQLEIRRNLSNSWGFGASRVGLGAEVRILRGHFREHFKMNLIHVKAEDRFLEALAGVTDPEEKRKIIGETFIRVFEEVAVDIEDADLLVQGTLQPM